MIEFILQCKQANNDAPIEALFSILTRDLNDKGRSFQYSSTRRLALSNRLPRPPPPSPLPGYLRKLNVVQDIYIYI